MSTTKYYLNATDKTSIYSDDGAITSYSKAWNFLSYDKVAALVVMMIVVVFCFLALHEGKGAHLLTSKLSPPFPTPLLCKEVKFG